MIRWHMALFGLLTLLALPALAQDAGDLGSDLVDDVTDDVVAEMGGDAGEAPSVFINEIRIDMQGTDTSEFLELTGAPGTSLAGLTLFIVGDGNTTFDGTIERVIPLTGQSIQGDGFFVVGAQTIDDLNLDLGDPGDFGFFENGDNVTYFLVTGFTGAANDDVDTNDDGTIDDGTIDNRPWAQIVDLVAVVEDFPEDGTPPTFADNDDEWTYGPPDPACTNCPAAECGAQSMTCNTVPPQGDFAAAHLFRCPDGTGDWTVVDDFASTANDTPGAPNNCDGGGGDAGPDMGADVADDVPVVTDPIDDTGPDQPTQQDPTTQDQTTTQDPGADPTVPSRGGSKDDGCGCSASGSPAANLWLTAFLLGWVAIGRVRRRTTR